MSKDAYKAVIEAETMQIIQNETLALRNVK